MSEVAAAPVAAPVSSPTPAPAPVAPSPTGQNAPDAPSLKQGNTEKRAVSTPPAQPEYFEVKVDGKTKRMTRDELIRSAQLGMSATERFESAAQKEKQIASILDSAKKNPIQALMDPALGLTKEQIREAVEAWYAQEFIEPDTLSKEELRARNAERELKTYKEREADAKAKAQAEEEDRLTSQQREIMQKQIIDSIEEHKLPKNKFTVSRIAFYMRQAALKGFDAPMDLIVSQVKKERNDLIADLAHSAPGYDQLVEIFGEETINRIRTEDLKRLREGKAAKLGMPVFPGSSEGGSEPKDKSGKIDMSEVTRRLKQMRFGV